MQSVINNHFYQDLDDLDDDESMSEENPYQNQIDQIKEEFGQKSDVSKLITDKTFISHNQLIKHNLDNNIKDNIIIDRYNKDYQVIIQSIEYSEKEIDMMYRFVRDTFNKRFPELESLVPSTMDYIQCVKLIGNTQDLSQIDFKQILNQHQIVSINVAASASSGYPLQDEEQQNCEKTCDIILQLEDFRILNIKYIQSKMEKIAPNLSNLVGSMIAAQLMAASGGLDSLARMPACNIQLVGGQKNTNMGLTKIDKKTYRFGLFVQMDLVQKCPPDFQIRLVRMLSTNCAKAARVDQSQLNKKGEMGLRFKQEMMQRFSKIQEAAPAKKIKPLVIADEKPKRRRGGKKYRNMKERLGASEFQKYQNRLKFGDEEEQEAGFQGSGVGLGMTTNSGLLKISKKEKRLQLTKKQKQSQMPFKNKSIPTDGLTTSVAFTPVQAMSLINPASNQQQQNQKVNDNYFNKNSGFKTVINDKNKNLGQFLNQKM